MLRATDCLSDIQAECERTLRYIQYGDFIEGIRPSDPEFEAEFALGKIKSWIELFRADKESNNILKQYGGSD